MKIPGELIERFFKDACSDSESERVIKYLQENPEILEAYAGRKEWEEAGPDGSAPGPPTGEIWKTVSAATRPDVRGRWLRRIAVAATLSGAIFLGYKLITADNPRQPELLPGKLATAQTRVVQQRVIANTTGKEMKVVLEDGSVVRLQNNSELHFEEPFQHERRDMTLYGRAFFEVAKDKTRPFIVTAGGLSTTAVGTSFWVCENGEQGSTSVRLVTGRVMVKREQLRGMEYRATPVYLNPGQELVLQKQTGKYQVHQFRNNVSGAGARSGHGKREKEEELVFSNTPLNEVFEQLERKYGIPVHCLGKGFKQMTFTGRYGGQDTEADILQTIVLLNNLGMQRDSSGFIITK